MRRNSPWYWLTLFSCLFLFICVLLPAFNLIFSSFQAADGTLTLDGFRTFFAEDVYVKGLRNSLILSIVVTILSIMLGVPLAFITVRYNIPMKTVLSILPITIIVIPELITTQAWLVVFGYNGFLTNFLSGYNIDLPNFYGWFGLIFVLTLTYYVHVYMGALAALRSFDVQLEEAAQSLGRTPLIARIKTMIPLVAPAIFSSGLVIFTLVLGDFSVAIILGHGVPLLSVLTYNSFLSEIGLNPIMQSTLATVSILIVAGVLFFQKRVFGKRNYQMTQGRSWIPVNLTGIKGKAALSYVFILVALTLMPLLLIMIASVTKSIGPVMHWGEFTLSHFERVWIYGRDILVNSLTYASLATLFGVIFGSVASYLIIKKKNIFTGGLDFLVMLPLAISGTVLGISLAQAFNSGLIVLTGTPVIMVLAMIIRRLPFAVRNASANLYNISDSIEEASISLGVPQLKSFLKVVIPLMAPGIASAAVLMWAMTMAELNSTLIVYQAGQETLPIQIFRLIDSDLMGQASAFGVLMISTILLPIFVAVKFFKIKLFK